MQKKTRSDACTGNTEQQTNNQDNTSTASKKSQVRLDKKSREWTCLVYPESAPDNWRELVQQTFLEAYISPCHDEDTNPDAELKKPHFHVVLAWAGPTTFQNAKDIMESFGGVIEPRVVGSLRGICRYLCHLDNPEKAQYDPKDVICYNGADWTTAISLKSDRYSAIEEMMDFCDHYQLHSFQALNTYARNERKADWFRALCDGGAYIMREYCKSLQWQKQDGGIMTIEDIKARMEDIDSGNYIQE